ncbi:MAG TPA: TonB family protein [Candidatus Acidoferrum sp.]|nr:TonB family protein [Candidatus Acidoferrum sp.]
MGIPAHAIIGHFMSLGQVNRGLNILGQGGAATAARMAPIPEEAPASAPTHAAGNAGLAVEPKLAIPWNGFHQGFWSSLGALFSGPFGVRKFLGGDYFRDCWIEGRMPMRAVIAAALWHVVFFVSPFSLFNTVLPHNSAFDNTQLTWSGPIEDFPNLEIAAAKPKPVLRTDTAKKLPVQGADAFHPRQRILTDPVHPNHPRQTLLNPKAPQIAPKLLPELPNIVQVQAAAPPRPHVEINAADLAKLHPIERRRVATAAVAPLPDMTAAEPKPADVSLVNSPNGPARPKLDLNASAAPRMTERAQASGAVAAPQLNAAQPGGTSSSTLVALSSDPAPPKPEMQPPAGNLAARVSISPEGKKPGGSPVEGANSGGTSPVGIRISGGNPKPNGGVPGLGGAPTKLNLPSSRALDLRPNANNRIEEAPARSGPPNFSLLPPGAKPEQVFADKRVYTLNVQMANLNSASGSWILHFSELGGTYREPESAATELTGLAPIHKVDPKYPPDLIEQNVEGDVVLYAVIRKDGSVDSIQVVRSVDPQLDANAKYALGQWKFRPAMKNGVPVELEAIVHVPFKLPDNR